MRQSCVDTLVTEEPDDRIGHVRICGGAGRVTGRLYPEADPSSADHTPARYSVRWAQSLGHPAS
jgi:hypothetical protein